MSKYKSKHGLKYVVDDELYAELQRKGSNDFSYFNNSLEMAELIPTVLLLVAYFLCLFVIKASFWQTSILCLIVFLISYPLSMLSIIYRSKVLVSSFRIFEIITKFLLILF